MNIIFRGVALSVDFDGEEGQDSIIRPDPNDSEEGFPSTIEINSVKVGGVDVLPLFDDAMEEELISLILEDA